MGWGPWQLLQTKKIALLPFEKKYLHGIVLTKLSFKSPKKIFLLKFFPLKCFSLKIHENRHSYAPSTVMKSKDFKKIKWF